MKGRSAWVSLWRLGTDFSQYIICTTDPPPSRSSEVSLFPDELVAQRDNGNRVVLVPSGVTTLTSFGPLAHVHIYEIDVPQACRVPLIFCLSQQAVEQRIPFTFILPGTASSPTSTSLYLRRFFLRHFMRTLYHGLKLGPAASSKGLQQGAWRRLGSAQ
jgi:hypothetical protein